PERPILHLYPSWRTGQLQLVGARHLRSEAPPNDAVRIALPLEANVFLQAMHPPIVREGLWQAGLCSQFRPREVAVRRLEGLLDHVPKVLVAHWRRRLSRTIPVGALALGARFGCRLGL